MRLIDADILWEQVAQCSPFDALALIEDATTVDAVEVVRCKDCRYFNRHGLQDYTECTHFDCDVTEDGYCWWGERKEDGN